MFSLCSCFFFSRCKPFRAITVWTSVPKIMTKCYAIIISTNRLLEDLAELKIGLLDLLTYCRVASQFIVWAASAAFSILAESSLHCSLSLASSVILTRSSVDWSLKWSISPRSLFTTIGRVVVGRPLRLWPYWMK